MEFNPFSVADKTILITGASSGIGRKVAIVLSKLGAKTILLARNEERLQKTKKELFNISDHLVYAVDLLNTEKVKKVIAEIKSKVNKIDGLINCAGFLQLCH